MNRPDAVVFDLGKVLVDFDYGISSRRIAARSKRSAEEVRAVIDHAPLLYEFETGKIDRTGFYREISSQTGYAGTLSQFVEEFAEIFTPIDSMIELQQALRARRVPTYIFSNTNDIAISHIRARFPFFAQFDGYVLSYEHHSMKPESRLYERVEGMTGLLGPRIVYLDDRPENIAAGRSRGWQVVLQEAPEKSWAALRDLRLLD